MSEKIPLFDQQYDAMLHDGVPKGTQALSKGHRTRLQLEPPAVVKEERKYHEDSDGTHTLRAIELIKRTTTLSATVERREIIDPVTNELQFYKVIEFSDTDPQLPISISRYNKDTKIEEKIERLDDGGYKQEYYDHSFSGSMKTDSICFNADGIKTSDKRTYRGENRFDVYSLVDDKFYGISNGNLEIKYGVDGRTIAEEKILIEESIKPRRGQLKHQVTGGRISVRLANGMYRKTSFSCSESGQIVNEQIEASGIENREATYKYLSHNEVMRTEVDKRNNTTLVVIEKPDIFGGRTSYIYQIVDDNKTGLRPLGLELTLPWELKGYQVTKYLKTLILFNNENLPKSDFYHDLLNPDRCKFGKMHHWIILNPEKREDPQDRLSDEKHSEEDIAWDSITRKINEVRDEYTSFLRRLEKGKK
jgi:hypothetical protein